MAKNVYIFLADGFEDIEGLAVVDLMRRAGIRITTVSIMDKKEVVTSHHIALLAILYLMKLIFQMRICWCFLAGCRGQSTWESMSRLQDC